MKRLILLTAALLPLAATAQQASSGSIFVKGLARVGNGEQTWYIDSTGNKAFDELRQLQASQNGRRLARKGNRFGIAGADGGLLLPVAYDEIDTRWADIWKVKKNGKTGWADSSGRVLLPPQFDDAGYLDGTYFDVRQNGKWGIYHAASRQWAIPAEYEGFDYCGGCGHRSPYVYAKKNGKWGVIDFSRRVLAPFEYGHQHSRMRSDNWVTAFTRNGKPVALNLANGKEYPRGEVIGNLLVYAGKNGMGLVNSRGAELLPPEYEEIGSPDPDFSPYSGYLSIRQKDRWGLVDSSGRMVAPPRYDNAPVTVFDSLFTAEEKGLHILLNGAGQHLLPDGCTGLKVMRGAAAVAYRRNGKYGVYHVQSGRLTQPVYDDVEEQFYGSGWLRSCVVVVKDGWHGLLGPDGREVVPPQFDDEFSEVCEGFVAARKNKTYALYNAAGRQLAPAEYYSIRRGLGDTTLLVLVKEEGDGFRHGIIDSTGAAVLPVAYDDMSTFRDSLLLLYSGDKKSVFNTRTRQLSDIPDAEAAFFITPHMLLLTKKEGYQLFNLRTRKAATPLYDRMGNFGGGAAVVAAGDRVGMIDREGNVILPLAYEYAQEITPGLALIGKGGRYGYADSTGRIIVTVQYDYNTSAYAGDYQRGRYLLLEKKNGPGGVAVGLAERTGGVAVEPVYDAVFTDEADEAFLVMKDRKFGLLSKNGRLAVPVEYDDVIPSSINRFTGTFTFTWPLLCRKGQVYLYIGRNGKPLPLQVKEVVALENTGW